MLRRGTGKLLSRLGRGAGLVLVLWGCDGASLHADASSPVLPAAAGLQPVAGCDGLEDAWRGQLTRGMEEELTRNLLRALRIVGEEEHRCLLPGDIRRVTAAAEAEGGSGGGAPGAQQYTTTTLQVAGVDEADFVKNDGSTIYLLAGNELLILQAWPADQTHVLASIPIDGQPARLFVEGDRAVVYSHTGAPQTCGALSFEPSGKPGLTVLVLDISDRTMPRVERRLTVNGSYVAARRVGSGVHTVLEFPGPALELPTWPTGLDVCDQATTLGDVQAAFAQLLAQNHTRIAALDLSAFLPTAQDLDVAPDGAVHGVPDVYAGCGSFFLPAKTTGTTLVSVLSFAMDDDATLGQVSVIGASGDTYASASSLYVAALDQVLVPGDGWRDWGRIDEHTTLFKFGIDATGRAPTFRASGAVPGRLVNQFAMDEHQGRLRVATTQGYLPDPSTTNALYVLEEEGCAQGRQEACVPSTGRLVTVGALPDLARGEDIRSVRFAGDRGFMVTFKKTDPLFGFDLSNPAAPRLTGELKIPGFSTYMHFMDEQHLLTVGFDAADQGSFAYFTGVLLQIFDVTDMASPTLQHRHVIGTRGTTSDATDDHMAFTYFRERGLLALPMGICEGEMFDATMVFNGLMVLDVSLETGFAERARIDHQKPGEAPQQGCYTWWQTPNSAVKRSIFMEDYVYSLSAQRLRVSHLEDQGATGVVDIDLPGAPAGLCGG